MKLRLLAGAVGLALVLWLLPRTEPAAPQEQYHVAMGTLVRLAVFASAEEAEPMQIIAYDMKKKS